MVKTWVCDTNEDKPALHSGDWDISDGPPIPVACTGKVMSRMLEFVGDCDCKVCHV